VFRPLAHGLQGLCCHLVDTKPMFPIVMLYFRSCSGGCSREGPLKVRVAQIFTATELGVGEI
jgi:hypothetical protein